MSYEIVNSAIARGEVHSVILTAGVAKRTYELGDRTKNLYALPKCAMPLGSYFIGDFGLRSLVDMGLRTINVCRGPFPDIVRSVYNNSRYPGVDFRFFDSHPEIKLNTAGNVHRVVRELNLSGTIIVRSADIASNIEPHIPLRVQLAENRGVGLTIVVNPVPWDTITEFGTVKLSGMPERGEFQAFETLGQDTAMNAEFEGAIDRFVGQITGMHMPILLFREKAARTLALSSLNNSSDYYISADLIRALGPALTPSRDENGPFSNSFSDWGGHVFEVMTRRDRATIEKFPSLVNAAGGRLAARIESGDFPFTASVMPTDTTYGIPSYWSDLGHPGAIWEGNQDVLNGSLFAKGLPERIIPRRELDNGAVIINSIISDDVEIGPHAVIESSVVREGAVIGRESRVLNSVIFPGNVQIFTGSTVERALVTGGRTAASYLPTEGHVLVVYESLDGQMEYSEYPIRPQHLKNK